MTTAGNNMATASPSYAQLQPASGSSGAGVIHVSQAAMNRSLLSGSSLSSGSPLQTLLNLTLPFGTDVNVSTPELGMSPLYGVSPGEDRQGVRGFLRGQAGEVNTPRIDTGNKGGDDDHPPDDGDEGQ